MAAKAPAGKAAARKPAAKTAAPSQPKSPKPPVRKAALKKAATRKAAVQKPGRKPRAKSFQVQLGNNGKVIECARHETVLHAALRAGIDYPYACATGNCGTCISKLDGGKVSLLPRNDTSLTAEQEEAGQTLACRARPRSDLSITWLGRGRK